MHDQRTAELRRIRELLEQLEDLAGLPKTPEADALVAEIVDFLWRHRNDPDA